VTACPVCGSLSPDPFLHRAGVPVHQNLIVRDERAALALGRGRLSLHVCKACGFVFNAAFDPSLLSYGAAYDNTQSCSPAFEAYVEELAGRIVHERGVQNARIVEVGCGKGAFLRALVHRHPGNVGVGFDPSYEGPETAEEGRARFERRFFDETCGALEADVVVCRHVIEHIADPVKLLRVVRATLGHRPARVFFETPCVAWILEHEVIWDFFYEHCSYFTSESLATAFERAGFEVDSITHTFGGQYLWAEAHPAAVPVTARLTPGNMPMLARRFAEHEANRVEALRGEIETLAREGPVALWGAAAKGVTLANLIDKGRQLFACVVDVNPNKHGALLPGTGHRIVAPEDLRSRNVRTAVLTNPNYFDENARLLRAAALDVRLVDLMHPGEVNARSH
jgi:2-polyprenyl-3-methyl-5-hydroxy-6-metoxy-1,4-benzoquinol methylase